MKKFLDNYKVLLTGIAAAITIVLQQYIGPEEISWKAIAIACILAISGVLGNYLRGQWPSLAGIIGIVTMTLENLLSGGVISWDQVAISLAVAILSLVAPPAKLRGYEHDNTIKSAKTKR